MAAYYGQPRSTRAYLLAILAAVLALYLRQLLFPLLGNQNPYHTVWAAVMFSAWFCGVGPGIVTTLISLLGVWYLVLPAFHWFREPRDTHYIFGMVGFVVFSAIIIGMGEASRRNRNRLADILSEVENSRKDLEERVLQRTNELQQATDSLRELSGRLLQLRDNERRRVARELHDSVGQMVAAVSMDLSRVKREIEAVAPTTAVEITEIIEMVRLMAGEVRTISHLLHPPLLEEAGLSSAVRWFVEGYGERSKIRVELEMSEMERMSSETEIAVFRLIQECLTNVHRHSGSEKTAVRLRKDDSQLIVQVQDWGRGIPLSKQLELSSVGKTGVGFRGMRERLRQLGGTLHVESDLDGTVVTAYFPRTVQEAESTGSQPVLG
jgi:signal transduction histidine kinase